MKKMLFALLVVSLLPQLVEARMRTLSWTAPTHNTDNTPITSVLEYRAGWSYDNTLADENINWFTMADNTLTSCPFDDAIFGATKDSTIYLTVRAFARSTGLGSDKAIPYRWQVGADGLRSVYDFRMEKLSDFILPDTIAGSFNPPQDNTVNVARYELWFKTEKGYDDLSTGAKLNLGLSTSFCMSTPIDNAFYAQVATVTDNGTVYLSEKKWYLAGAVECDDLTTCAVDASHSTFIFNPLYTKYLSDYGESIFNPPCGQPFVVPVHSSRMKAYPNSNLRFDWYGDQKIKTKWGNRTKRLD
ncbi:MAG: hypothetical protein WC924_06155 [Candidatus Gracilibacteria bacterium]